MITTRLARLGLPTLMLAATAVLATAPTAAAQPALPTYTCQSTPSNGYYVWGRGCSASPGAHVGGTTPPGLIQMENSVTGEQWVCSSAEVGIGKRYDPSSTDPYLVPYELDRILNDGVDGNNCYRILA